MAMIQYLQVVNFDYVFFSYLKYTVKIYPNFSYSLWDIASTLEESNI